MLRAAFNYHSQGKLEKAEDAYRRILQIDPDQAHALHLLGVIAHQAGQPAAAIQLISRAISIDSEIADFHNNIGEAYRVLGRNEEAIGHYRRVLSLEPVNPGAACNMGSALFADGRIREAVDAFKKALGFKPDFAEAKAKLGAALIRLPKDDPDRDVDRGIALLRDGIHVNPNFVEGYVNLANAMAEREDYEEAVRLYREALERDPNDVGAHFNLGAVLLRMNEIVDGVAEIDQALGLAPEDVDLVVKAGEALQEVGRTRAVILCYRKAVELAPDRIDLQERLGDVLDDAGRKRAALTCYENVLKRQPTRTDIRTKAGKVLITQTMPAKALEHFERVREEEPDDPQVLIHIGRCLQRLGRFAEAAAKFRQAHEMMPNNPGPFYNLVQDKEYRLSPQDLEKLAAIAADESAGNGPRTTAYFTLGDSFHQMAAYDAAFQNFAAGNALVHAEQDADINQLKHLLAAETAVFDAPFFEERWAHGDDSDRPVFVVGVPRSGTTLTEQILARHPDIAGAGELNDISNIQTFLNIEIGTKTAYPGCAREMDSAATRRIAHQYLERLDETDPNTRRVVDKMPGNFIHLGLIGLLFPNAKVIHLQRDPIDTCVSCYFQLFQRGMSYVWDLEELGKHYRCYLEFMAHWHTVRPVEILDIRYEELVAEPERVARQMIDFVGLDWDDRCLERNPDAAIVTASLWQARQPVYTTSVQGWKRYEKHLGPLIEALGDAVERPPAPAS